MGRETKKTKKVTVKAPLTAADFAIAIRANVPAYIASSAEVSKSIARMRMERLVEIARTGTFHQMDRQDMLAFNMLDDDEVRRAMWGEGLVVTTWGTMDVRGLAMSMLERFHGNILTPLGSWRAGFVCGLWMPWSETPALDKACTTIRSFDGFGIDSVPYVWRALRQPAKEHMEQWLKVIGCADEHYARPTHIVTMNVWPEEKKKES